MKANECDEVVVFMSLKVDPIIYKKIGHYNYENHGDHIHVYMFSLLFHAHMVHMKPHQSRMI